MFQWTRVGTRSVNNTDRLFGHKQNVECWFPERYMRLFFRPYLVVPLLYLFSRVGFVMKCS